MQRLGLIAGVLLCCGLAVVARGASEDVDQKRLEVARQLHEKEVARAQAVYRQAVERANAQLQRAYESVIKRCGDRGDTQAAQTLTRELEQQLTDASPKDAASSSAQPRGHQKLIQAIGRSVVNAKGQPINAKTLEDKQYVMLYFSAHWCPPCRAFTPKLVAYYRENRTAHNFDVVLVSSDQNKKKMLSYMKQMKMPWVALPYGRIDASGLKQQYGGTGIPNLVILDAQGNAVFGSYNDQGQYIGPGRVLDEMTRLLKQTSAKASE